MVAIGVRGVIAPVHVPIVGRETVSLRSAQWYAGDDRNAYIHRAWMRRGLPDDAFDGRPQIAIANTASDLTPCNAHLDEVAEQRQAAASTRPAASR